MFDWIALSAGLTMLTGLTVILIQGPEPLAWYALIGGAICFVAAMGLSIYLKTRKDP